MADHATTQRGTMWGSLVAVAFIIGATIFTVSCFTDFATLLHVLASGHWLWIATAVATNLTYFIAYALVYRLGFALVGVSARTWSLMPVMFAGLFINLMVPTAGATALFVDDAVRRGQSGARASVGVVLVLLIDLVALLPFVAWGMTFLVREHLFAPWQLLAAGAFVCYLVLLVGLVALAGAKQAMACRVLGWVLRILRHPLAWIRVRGPSDDWPERTAAGLADAAAAIVAHPRRLVLAGTSGIVLHLMCALTLWLFVHGFGAVVPVGGLIAAYSVGIVLQVIAVVPQLAPLSQAFMTATFIDVGVAAGPSVAATLAFRGLTFALPLLLGLPAAWRIGRTRTAPRR